MKTMTKDEMRVAIAEKCGIPQTITKWTFMYGEEKFTSAGWKDKSSADCERRELLYAGWKHITEATFYETYNELPNYPEDLNACHEMEKALTWPQCIEYENHLAEIIGAGVPPHAVSGSVWFAAAPQRCEALCRVFWPKRFES